MEHLFLKYHSPKYKAYFEANLEKYRLANPEAFYAMQSLAEIIGLEVSETLILNVIVDFTSYCTSIVARMTNGTIIHARNLDFGFPEVLHKLVYKGLYKKNGKIVAEAPSIWEIGAYTGLKIEHS